MITIIDNHVFFIMLKGKKFSFTILRNSIIYNINKPRTKNYNDKGIIKQVNKIVKLVISSFIILFID